ncbi:uncharacterized protein LOC125297389 [Alosa alosa]|uniref:uncharacterized protein LOC125297389 n=1 Tax=Alosa alosa TaxID=278164 RepID=UPI0020150F50|nr:uncharacterized protein LOC125297389 [Alosa alosa]
MFRQKMGWSETVKKNKLSATDSELLKAFRQDLAKIISALQADALVEMFHQKFSGHVITLAQTTAKGTIEQYVEKGLKSERTKEKLKAAENNRYIAYAQLDKKSGEDVGERSRSHAVKVQKQRAAGTLLDIRVLSETTGTKMVILTPDKHGRLTKFQVLNPSTKPASQTVTLVYRPKSAGHPEGHYDVLINNQTVPVSGAGEGCLYHAIARGRKPEANEKDIGLEASRLRTMEASALVDNSARWEPFVKRKEWTDEIRGGDLFMAAGPQTKSTVIKILKEQATQTPRGALI